MTLAESVAIARVLLGRRSHGRRAGRATGGTRGTAERRERSILLRSSSGDGGLRPAGADSGEGRA